MIPAFILGAFGATGAGETVPAGVTLDTAGLEGGLLRRDDVGILLMRGRLLVGTAEGAGGAVREPVMEQFTPLIATCSADVPSTSLLSVRRCCSGSMQNVVCRKQSEALRFCRVCRALRLSGVRFLHDVRNLLTL